MYVKHRKEAYITKSYYRQTNHKDLDVARRQAHVRRLHDENSWAK